jgi:ornithine cyclodeaminase
MKYISSNDIEDLKIDPITCVEWVKEGFLMKNRSILPPKVSIHPKGIDFFNTMPCLLPAEFHTFGCKIVSRIAGNHPALKSDLMLFNSNTGEMISVMNADWITAMRTGAVAALSINTLRSSSAKIYSFIGLGVIGHSTLDCLLATNCDKKLIIRLKKYKDHAEKTVEKYKDFKNVEFQIVDEIDDLVKDSDVIVSCITEAKDILVNDTKLFKQGVLVVPVHTRGFQNCDSIFDKVFADDEGHVKGFRYFNEFRKFGEIGDVISGKIEGRESDTERILSYNVGIGLHDIYFAKKISDLLLWTIH